MGRKRTRELDYRIIEEVAKALRAGHLFAYMYIVPKSEFNATRETVYKGLKRLGLGGQASISYEKGDLVVRKRTNKQTSVGNLRASHRNGALVKMVRKLMLHVDNDKLYDEAQTLLGGLDG